MNRFFVYLPIEILSRELHSRLLIAKAILRNPNVAVVLGPRNLLNRAGNMYPPGAILFKDLIDRTEQFQDAQKRDNKVAIINEEGLVYPSPESYIERRFDPQAWKIIDRYYSWGENEKKDIITHLGDPRNVVKVVGNPRIDLLKDRSLFKSKHIKMDGYIQINSTFGHVNPVTKKQKKAQVERSEMKAGNVWSKYHEESRELFTKFEELLHSLGRQNKYKIVFRPHPEEKKSYWEQIASRYKNIRVDMSLSAVEWISKASVVIHNNCTSAIEAYVMGVPTISLGMKERARHYSLANDLSFHAEDVTECMHQIEDLFENPHKVNELHQSNSEENLISRCNSFKKWNSYKLIADDLLSLIDEKYCFSVNKLDNLSYGFRSKLRRFKNLHSKKIDSVSQKFPGLDKNYLNSAISLIDQYDKEEPLLKNINKYCIDENIWLFTGEL